MQVISEQCITNGFSAMMVFYLNFILYFVWG